MMQRPQAFVGNFIAQDINNDKLYTPTSWHGDRLDTAVSQAADMPNGHVLVWSSSKQCYVYFNQL